MHHDMKSSYIIPYKDDEFRQNNLKIVLNHLMSFNDLEIIVVEQDAKKKLKLDFVKKHIFISHSGPFNRSWALNVGAMNSSTEILTFADGDILIKQKDYVETINACEKYDVVDPMKNIWFLKEHAQNCFSNEGAELIEGTNTCGGIVSFKREKFLEVKGWDECFEGWGYEDGSMTAKINTFNFSIMQLPFELYHLYHKRYTIKNMPNNLNKKIFESIKRFNLEQLKQNHLNKIKEIGNLFNYNIRND